MSPNMSGLVLLLIVAIAQAALFIDDDGKMVAKTNNQFGPYVTELDKLKRSFGRNCMFTITGCFTSSQAERYRKYMENVRFIPK
uniref:Secreted protein n=1 Tax=Caenorhabditis tropicalis TaxID=1561998 RepID=A0A1I7TAY8_9PELO